MSNRPALAVLLLALLAGCNESKKEEPGKPAHTPEELVKQLDASIAELQAKPEHTEPKITVQHILVGVKHPQLPPKAQRTPEEAKRIAAEVLGRIRAGEDFDLLVKNYTDDAHPGIYAMTLAGPTTGEVFARRDMVPAFGDVGWRLAVGEVGVAPHDPAKSPYGYHIVKRIR